MIITYDEHGGCYDHLPPPAATPPDGIIANAENFNFNAYGVRVPAVLISPYIPPGSKIRPPANADGSVTPFDHTSIIKTVRELFDLGAALTARDDAAPSVMSALSLAAPNNDGPPSVPTILVQPSPEELTARAGAVPNGMQDSLANAAVSLPAASPAPGEAIQAPDTPEAAGYPTVAIAAANAIARTNQFLNLI